MYMLAFESSAKSASAAVMADGRLLAQYFQSAGLTHSQTLLPMALDMLKNLGLSLSDMDVFAVSAGPGSFTGVRIGVSTVKGLCWGEGKPCVGVSTLEAMAYNGLSAPFGSVICCAMDARRQQVYNALFTFEPSGLKRLTPDRAISLDELAAELKNEKKNIFVVGDGAQLCYNHLEKVIPGVLLAPECVRSQCAWGVCQAARDKTPQSADALLPVYLRLSQAERERLERLKETKEI